ncbi:PREDICTED: U-box [Prunus dulcis]|uniref:RING-type E3 ubiquitin transferase n=2 Tax=Prunus dulcis TaxID=3755 RepID=A0A5E4E3U9_PRUDU|nr:U-box domain-containing protein 34 isoform X1 [Prunus dulcis]VVA10305.1 PREDICTED: U-box [Prunus dulcis]
MTLVAVAVKGGGSSGSRRAVNWAVENLIPKADRFVLVHVIPKITSIPTPSGDHIPVAELDAKLVATYVKDMKEKFEEVFDPFKNKCKTKKVETLVLEDDDPATGLLRFISESGINCLVLGSCSSNYITRKLKGPGVSQIVLRCAPHTCDVYVISRHRIIKNSDGSSSAIETSSASWMSTRDHKRGSSDISEHISGVHSFRVESTAHEAYGASPMSDLSYLSSEAFTRMGFSENASVDQETNHHNLGDKLATSSFHHQSSSVSSNTGQTYMQMEVEQLRLELQNTISMYKRACEELVHAQSKVQLLSSECLDEARRVDAALKGEETLRKIAAEEKEKHLKAMKEIEEAKVLLAKEAYERQIAELNAMKESSEKKKLVDALFSRDRRYRRYSRNEIEVATSFFSEANVIGEGGYGKVYKCSLDHTPVAVKVLRPDAVNKREEFLKEVEILSQLHHPNIVLLLGACPEIGCLVYEYLENGNLEDYISQRKGKPSLPWTARFRIVFEIACGLAFLHSSKVEPIVHRDLKPGNILLDRNYMSKIGDVGLAKLISNVVPDSITEYRESILAGTLFYMDPEYQRTGTVRPKSDLYAFGVIILQVLTARHPNRLIFIAENAMANGSFADILDDSVTDWPLAEAKELARVALRCSQLRCRDRPDLETEVLPVLKRLVGLADSSLKIDRNHVDAPSHYFCPILQEIMEDPHIAADGFTFEFRAIKAWLEKQNVSPVTRLRLKHSALTPNHTLRSAIQEWRTHVTYPST